MITCEYKHIHINMFLHNYFWSNILCKKVTSRLHVPKVNRDLSQFGQKDVI